MKFYRLEKKNYFKYWAIAILKSLGLSLLISIAFMIIMGYKFMIVSSGSMEPTLPVGSMVIVTPCDYEDLELNDIVTLENNGIYLTHRIVGKKIYKDGKYQKVEPNNPDYNDATWYTKGDANNTEDGPITKNVVGKVYKEHCFTFVGEIVRYVKVNYKIVIAFTVILVVFIEVINYLKSKLSVDDIECYDNTEEWGRKWLKGARDIHIYLNWY